MAVTLPPRAFPTLQFRPLQPDDFAALKLLHQQLFPIDYDDQFFQRAVAGLDQIASLAVVAPLQALPTLRSFRGAPLHPTCRGSSSTTNSSSSFASSGGPGSRSSNGISLWDQSSHLPTVKLLQAGQGQRLAASVVEELVGFITVKPFQLQHVEPRDRSLMGFGDPHWDQDSVLYILTLGVAEGFRGVGIASRLVDSAVSYAAALGCRAVYLHVITYNTPAMALYSRLGFCHVAHLPDFYVIRTGRQPNPHQQIYDAVLFALPLHPWIPWDALPRSCSPPEALCTPEQPAAAHAAPAGCSPMWSEAAPQQAPSASEAAALGSESSKAVAGAGSTMLRAVSWGAETLAACVPLTATCSPQRRPRRLGSCGSLPDKDWGSSSSGGLGGGGRQANGSWRGLGIEGNSRRSSGMGRGSGSETGGMLHRRAMWADGTAGQPVTEAADYALQQPVRPPNWLRGLFARG
ncbi:hypothetical protein N2152v2_009856 [Parachlorella kessleri]